VAERRTQFAIGFIDLVELEGTWPFDSAVGGDRPPRHPGLHGRDHGHRLSADGNSQRGWRCTS
jgi:hypothetical protein